MCNLGKLPLLPDGTACLAKVHTQVKWSLHTNVLCGVQILSGHAVPVSLHHIEEAVKTWSRITATPETLMEAVKNAGGKFHQDLNCLTVSISQSRFIKKSLTISTNTI